MFCEKCGTRVDDGQAFCPNCGNRLAAPAAPAYANPAPNPAPAAPGFGTVPPAPGYNPMPRQPRQPGEPLLGTLFDNFKELPTLLKIFLPIILGLICLNMLLTNGNPLSYSFYGYSLAVASFQEAGATWALLFINLFNICSLILAVLIFAGVLKNSLVYFGIVGAQGMAFLFFLIGWITSGGSLGVTGWFIFLFFLGIIALSVLGFIFGKKKN